MREEKLLNLRCGQRDRAPDALFSLPASIWRCALWRFAAREGQHLVMTCDGHERRPAFWTLILVPPCLPNAFKSNGLSSILSA
jgi:hypothetical protein